MPNLKSSSLSLDKIASFKQASTNNHHRSVFIISGDWAFCHKQLDKLINLQLDTWYLADKPTELAAKFITPKQATHYLGQQCQQLIINAHYGFDLNAFGALTGCVMAGGSCYILTPHFDDWLAQEDKQNERFNAFATKNTAKTSENHLVKHLINTFEQNDNIAVISQDKQYFSDIKPQLHDSFDHSIYKSEQQQFAVEKIIKVATGRRNRPLVLTADRGRGKSSALGLAASELIKAGKRNIYISAPQRSSVDPVFARLHEQLSDTKLVQDAITFIAIDALIAQKPTASLILIDEAAAIAAPLLTQIVSHYSRVVLTSTITGYEGTGRSFEIRFKHKLTELKPGWQQFHLQTPIRYAKHDPLEQLTNKALMLDAQAANLSDDVVIDQVDYQYQDRGKLVANYSQLNQISPLNQIVGLLSLAHYKTSPNDIRHLLNGNNIDIHTLSYHKSPYQQQIIAVAMVAKEGGFNKDIEEQIAQGQRRPKGHLLPLSLSAHSGLITAPNYLYARVVRIAVHPSVQQQSFGSQLLTHLQNHYQQRNFDFIGSSFGANQGLLSFWLKQQFTPVRIGITVEASSNEYAALVLKTLKEDNQAFINHAQTKFIQQFTMQIRENNPLICPFVAMILLSNNTTAKQLSPEQTQDLNYYLNFNREYEFCSHSLQAWLIYQLNQKLSCFLKLPPDSATLLVDKLIKQKSWPIIVKEQRFDSKKSAIKALKQLIKQLNP